MRNANDFPLARWCGSYFILTCPGFGTFKGIEVLQGSPEKKNSSKRFLGREG
jgi:hypothetical protein